MKKNYLSPNINTKEKEHALSLFRIPINFFSDDEKTNLTKNSSSTSNTEKVKLTPNGTTSINTNFEYTNSQSISISSEENSTTKTSSTTPSTPQLETKSTPPDSSTSSTSPSPTPSSPTPSSPIKPTVPQTSNLNKSSTPNNSNQIPHSPPSSPRPTPETTKAPSTSKNNENQEPTKNIKPNSTSISNEKDSNNFNESPKQKTTTPEKSAPYKPKDEKTKGELDRLRNKYSKSGKNKINDKINSKVNDKVKKLSDKANNLPLVKKANNIKNTLKNAKDITQNISEAPEKAAEAAGDMAVKAAALATTAINPAVGKAINIVDNVVGNTEIGKKSKKAIGCCIGGCCAGGCLLPLLLFLFIFIYLISSFSWALKWFGLEEDFTGMDYEEYVRIQEASYADFSLKNLINEIELGVNRLYNVEDTFTAIINNKDPKDGTTDKSTYSYLAADVERYNAEYEDLIKEGKLSTLKEGDLTAFGLIFDLLLDNYTVVNLKQPSLAPERQKDNITYITYDPQGRHQALFEEVLNNIDYLTNRFDGQVKAEWFKTNLVDVLDKKFDVYIHDMNETRSLSLRDLFKETSRSSYDTEYDRYIVSTILSDTHNNKEIIAQFNVLQKNLASLEMMTYMLYYQKFYHQKLYLRDQFKDCVNLDMFSDEFFAQFLTFTDIEQFIALSSLTDHSFVYEIAVSNLELLELPPTTKIEHLGNFSFGHLLQYTNWYATYNFDPEITINSDESYSYSMPCISMDKTSIQQKLFDKYNIESNFRYGTGENDVIEKTPEENAAVFFSIFELATGIPMSVGDDGVNIPVYDISADGVIVNSFTTSPLQGNVQGRITLPFGASYSDSTVAAFGVNRIHKGIDYGVPVGTPVYATASGTAYITYGNTGYGNYTKIIHDDGHTSIYAHGNGTFYVPNGSRVSAGQLIMQSGNSGNSTGPHLHFEVRNSNGTPINPTSYIYS